MRTAKVKINRTTYLIMKVTFATAGRTVTIECEGGTDCKTLRKLLAKELDRDLSSMSLYDKSDNSKLSDDSPAPTEVIGVKSKNESA